MEALEKRHDPLMGFYFSCPHCQQKYVSAECVQEHSPNCHMQPSSFLLPKIQSYSSLNPQATDLNFDSEGFQMRHEIIKKEPQDYYTENEHTDWQDETEYPTTLISPEEIHENVPNQQELDPLTTRPILRDSIENPPSTGPKPKLLRDSISNPDSTSNEDRYLCRYCPRTFPFPSVALNHEESHGREPKFSCRICGLRFRWPSHLTEHRKSHESPQMFTCSYPGCIKTFKSTTARWYHHKTHPAKGGWNDTGTRPRILRKNHPLKTVPIASTIIMPESESLFLDNQQQDIQIYPQTVCSIGESPRELTDQNNQNVLTTGLSHAIQSPEPAKVIRCCYPGCPKTFKHKPARWLHHKTHPKGNWNASGRKPGWNLRQNQTSNMSSLTLASEPTHSAGRPAFPGDKIEVMTAGTRPRILIKNQSVPIASTIIVPESQNSFLDNQQQDIQVHPQTVYSIGESSRDLTDQNVWTTGLSRSIESPKRAKVFPCCYPGCPKTFKSPPARTIHHKIHPKGRWNASGRKPGWNLQQNQTSTVSSEPIYRGGRPAFPGNEIEVMTESGRKFKCDLCDNIFTTRGVARYHRLGHFDQPQVACYMTGCSEMFRSRPQRINHLKWVHNVRFRNGRPFIGSRRVEFKRTETGKMIAKEISPSVHTSKEPSQSPQNIIQLNQSLQSDQNIPLGSTTGGLMSPHQTLSFTCGICNDNFENFATLQFHMTKTHAAGAQDSQADELKIIEPPALNSFGSVEFSCDGDQISVEVKENQNSYQPEYFNGGTKERTRAIVARHLGNQRKFGRRGPAPRYPSVTVGGKKYYCCGFPGCEAFFNHRVTRYGHQKKYHSDAPRSIFTYLPRSIMSGQLPDVSQVSRQSEDDGAMDQEADEPDISGLLHLSMDTLQQFENVDESLMQHNNGDFALLNQEDVKAESIEQTDGGLGSQLCTEASTFSLNPARLNISNPVGLNTSNPVGLNISNLVGLNISNPVGLNISNPVGLNISNPFGPNISNPARPNIANPTHPNVSKEKVVAYRPPLIDPGKWSRKGRKALYPTIQVGSKKMYPCDFPDCKAVFNSRCVRYMHHKKHLMGFKHVNSRLTLTDDGTVLNTSEGCYIID